MADPDSLDQRAGQLHAEHDYWEGVRRNAANELQQQRDAEAQEELKSRLSTAGFNLDQIAQELNRIERLREAVAQDPGRDGALKEEFAKQEREKVEAFQKEEQQKAEFQKEEQQKAEAFKKEEQQKTEAFEKELQEKESFEKQERETKEAFAEEAREKQEAFEKEERDKQEFEKQEIQKKEQSALDDLAKTADYIQDQVNSEWDYVDKQIQSELEYSVGQAVAAFAEAGFEIGMAIANPVSQKEAGQYLEQQNQGLRDLTSDEVFQGAPAEHKAMWLEEKFKDLQQAEQEKFGERK